MTKLDNFKKFIASHPDFIDMVRNNNTTWQSLYELYDIYGENESIWNKYLTSSHKDTFSMKGLLNTIKSIDIASLEENINSIQKAVSLVEELTKETKKEETSTPKESKIDNLYGDKDE